MNSPVEDRLREALAEAGATIDSSRLRPLRATEPRRARMDLRLVAAAAVVVLAGAATAAVGMGRGAPEDVDLAVATAPEPVKADISVFLCVKPLPKESQCTSRGADRAEIEAVGRELKTLPQVEAVHFADQAAAYDRFRAEHADDRALLGAVTLTDFPVSFKVTLKQGADRTEAWTAIRDMPGVGVLVDHAAVAAGLSEKPVLSVFLCGSGSSIPACGKKAATPDEKKALNKLIAAMPGVRSVLYENRKMAYENSKRQSGPAANAARVSDMPESYRLTLEEGSPWSKMADELTRQPGVASAVYSPCAGRKSALLAGYGLFLPAATVCRTVR
jgi:cell division protein FtsX